jgi:hypothetical protein
MPDPISLQVVNKAKEILETITVANGYEQDIQQVLLLDEIPEEALLPAIMLATTRDQYTEEQGGWQHNSMFVTAIGYQVGWWDLLPRIHRLHADIHKALLGAYVAAGSWGADHWDGLAVNYRPSVNYPFTDFRNSEQVSGVQFDFVVQYRHAELDPYAAP